MKRSSRKRSIQNLDSINADLDELRVRLQGLGNILSTANPDPDWPIEDSVSALRGTGALILEECRKLESMRPLIGEHALHLSGKL